MRLALLLLLFCAPLLASGPWQDPWGTDAELTKPKAETPPHSKNPLTYVAKGVIHFHQKVISPTDGPRSNYVPCSSTYARRAIEKYGFFKGFVMGCDRLMRENADPWLYPSVEIEGRTLKEDPP